MTLLRPLWLIILVLLIGNLIAWEVLLVARHFSLRTLLIATTLAAVMLGTAAYLRLW